MPIAPLQVGKERIFGLPYPVQRHLADVQRLLHHAEVNREKLSIIRPKVALGRR